MFEPKTSSPRVSRALKIVALLAALISWPGGVTCPARAPSPRVRGVTSRTNQANAGEPLAFVVNRANPVDNLTSEELRRYFLAERTRWENGRRVTLIMRAQGQPERDAVLRLVYRMREQEFNFYFLHAQFTGEIEGGPKVLDDAQAVLRYVSYVPGALAYVRAAEVSPAVKVLRIDGLAPTDPGYKISL